MTTTTTTTLDDPAAALTAADCLSAAERLAPRIRELAPAIDKARRLPPELVAELRQAGFFRMLLPVRFGGLGLDPVAAARVIEAVSQADGAAGWCLMIAGQNAMFAGFLDDDDVRTVWGNGEIVCGTARPIGRAVATTQDGRAGYQVSGRWPFASGSSHADWFAAECLVFDGDQPRLDAKGDQVSRMVFVPREFVTVHDTWDTLGLRGTASNDFSIESAFVPAGLGFQMIVDKPRQPDAVYRAFPLVFIGHGAQALGLAQAAIEAATEIAATKRGWGGVPLRELPRIQAVVAEAEALVASARLYLYDAASRLWQASLAGTDDARLRARVRLATSNATKASVQAVDMIQSALATAAIVANSRLERCFRDVRTAGAHVMIGSMTFEAAGRVLLGLDADFPFF